VSCGFSGAFFTIAQYVLWAFFSFYELLQSSDLLHFYKAPLFYITLGLLYWHVCVILLFTFGDYFATTNANHLKLGELLVFSIDILAYSCFIFGFLFECNHSIARIRL
jgi:hypothetical protein